MKHLSELRLGKGDLRYLVTLLASAQSLVSELSLELIRLGADAASAADAIRYLAKEGLVGVLDKSNAQVREYSLVEMYSLAELVFHRGEDQTELFLTEAGWARWDTDDWDISSKRAREIRESLSVAARAGRDPSIWSRLRGWLSH